MGLIIKGSKLVKYEEEPGVTSVVVPDVVKEIGAGAFAQDMNDFVYGRTALHRVPLKSVTLPEGLTTIGSEAFMNCWDLESINLPDSLVSIGSGAFLGDDALRGLRIPVGVKTIGSEAFKSCSFEFFEMLSPDCRFGRDIFATMDYSLPYFVTSQLDTLVDHFSWEDLVNYIFRNYWDLLSDRKQAELFLTRLSDPALQPYSGFLNAKNSAGLIRTLPGLITPDSSEQECLAAASLLTDHQLGISQQDAQAILSRLQAAKSGSRALARISVSDRARATLHLAPLTQEEQPEGVREYQKTLDAMGINETEIAKTLKSRYGLVLNDLPKLSWKDGLSADTQVLALLLAYEDRINELRALLALIDHDSLMTALRTLADGYFEMEAQTKKINLSYPVCRYGDEALMTDLCSRVPGWATGRSGFGAPLPRTFISACMASDTFAAVCLADEQKCLDDYLALRREESLDAIYVRTISENGAHCCEPLPLYALWTYFLSGEKLSAYAWQAALYQQKGTDEISLPFVWAQGKNTFLLTGSGAVKSNGSPYQVKDKPFICMAHPLEMDPADLIAWRDYFRVHHIQQPFDQITEAVYSAKDITPDRYDGYEIPLQKLCIGRYHGIHVKKHGLYRFDISMDGIRFDYDVTNIWEFGDETFVPGELHVRGIGRKSNHLLWVFDHWTIEYRIREDDMNILPLAESCSVQYLVRWLDLAIEYKAVNLTAALQDMKQRRFPDADPLSELNLAPLPGQADEKSSSISDPIFIAEPNAGEPTAEAETAESATDTGTAASVPANQPSMPASAPEVQPVKQDATPAVSVPTSCAGLTFVITGKVNRFKNRDEFIAFVEAHGGKVKGSVNAGTDFLVNNDTSSTSTKNRKAKELGIPIISEAEFMEAYGGPMG